MGRSRFYFGWEDIYTSLKAFTVWDFNSIWFDKNKNYYMSLKVLTMWDFNLIWFDEDKNYLHDLETFNHVRS